MSKEQGRVKLPVGLGFGASIRQGTRWLAGGADFQTQNWNTYRYFGASDSLADSWRVSVGGQFTSNDRVLKNRYKTVQYRAGFHYARTFLQLRGNQLNEMGVSIGLGIPIRRASTFIQFAAEAERTRYGRIRPAQGTLPAFHPGLYHFRPLVPQAEVRLISGFDLNFAVPEWL